MPGCFMLVLLRHEGTPESTMTTWLLCIFISTFLASSDLDLEGDVALVQETDLDLEIAQRVVSTQEVECHLLHNREVDC